MPKRGREDDKERGKDKAQHDTEADGAVLTKRIQIDMPLAIFDILADLKRRTFASSYSEVFKNSLRIYRWYVRVWEANERIQVIKQDGSIKDVEMIVL